MIESECQVLYATFVPSSMADIFFDWNRRWNFLCSACFEEITGATPGAKDLAIAAPARVAAEFEQWQREDGGCQWCGCRFTTAEVGQ